MPKASSTPFEVDGVQCSIKDGLVNVGLNAGWPASVRFPIKAGKSTSLDDVKDKVRAHTKFVQCKALADGSPHQPVEQSVQSEGNASVVGVRELESLRELNKSADGPAMQFGWRLEQYEQERIEKERLATERQTKQDGYDTARDAHVEEQRAERTAESDEPPAKRAATAPPRHNPSSSPAPFPPPQLQSPAPFPPPQLQCQLCQRWPEERGGIDLHQCTACGLQLCDVVNRLALTCPMRSQP